jgi:hypothetical protein
VPWPSFLAFQSSLSLSTDCSKPDRHFPIPGFKFLILVDSDVTIITVLPNGLILGWFDTPTVYTPWTQVPDSGYVIAITLLRGGTILGIDPSTISSPRFHCQPILWEHVSNSSAAISVALLSRDQILGVGTDDQLLVHALLTSPWVLVPNSGSVISCTVLPNGTIVRVDQLSALHACSSDQSSSP